MCLLTVADWMCVYITQVFAKTSSSLRYDKNRRQFVTVLESRHPLYRGLFDALAHHNERVRRLKRAKVWLRSIMEIVRVGLHGRGRGHKVCVRWHYVCVFAIFIVWLMSRCQD